MAADVRVVLSLFILVVGILALIAVGTKAFKTKGAMRATFLLVGIAAVAFGAVSAGGQFGLYELPDSVSPFFLTSSVEATPVPTGNTQVPTGTPVITNQPSFQPTATYTGKDAFSTTTVSGTSYYKSGSAAASTTAKSNVNVDTQVTYWIDNATYWVQPQTLTIVPGVNEFVAKAWQNSSASVTLYDQVARASVTNGVNNISMGANDKAIVEVTYTGPSQGSAGPFGGLMVAEYNSTISSVTCTGDDLLNTNNFHLTYTVSDTAHTFKAWAYGPSLDDGDGDVKRINCQFQNGATAAGVGSKYYFKFIPANYYVSDAGDILLDTEKFASGETTRTGSTKNLPSVFGGWAA